LAYFLAAAKNAKAHLVHQSERVWEVIKTQPQHRLVFATAGGKNFQSFKFAKKNLDQLSGATEWRTRDFAARSSQVWRVLVYHCMSLTKYSAINRGRFQE
jgi:hypothetical protein